MMGVRFGDPGYFNFHTFTSSTHADLFTASEVARKEQRAMSADERPVIGGGGGRGGW